MILDFNVHGQTLTAVPPSDIPRRGSREYLQLRFHFSDDWDNYTIKTVFFQHQEVYEPFFIDKTCIVDVPNYFTSQTHFLIALTGISADIQEFCPTNSIGISLGDSGVVFSAEPPNVPPSAYQQMLQYVQQAAEILSWFKANAVRSVNDILPEEESGNVTLAPKDIPVQIPGAGFQNLQALLESLYAGPICSVSGMLTNSPAGSTLYQGAVTAGTLPEIQTGDKPAGVNTQIIFTPSGTNTFPPKLMLQGQAIEIRRRAYPDLNGATEALPAKSLQKNVPYMLTFSGQYWLLDSYVPLADSERNVTELCQAWLSSNSGTVKDFFLSGEISEPGTYVVYAAGYTWRMRYTTASGGEGSSVWRWIVYYTEDGFFAASLYCNKKLVIDFDPDSGIYKVYDDALALKSEIGTGGAREPYTEIEKSAQRPMRLNRILRIQLHGLEPFDNGHLRLALWRCSRKYDRYRWLPARAVSRKEDNSIGYGRIRGTYGNSKTGADYPAVPGWMPNEGLAEPFYSVYGDDGSLLPYVEIPLDTFVLPLVKPEALTVDRTAWEDDPWARCAVVGTSKRSGFLRFDFRVETEDGTVVARCRNTVKIGARNSAQNGPSGALVHDAGGGKNADLKNWYVAID